MSKDTDPTDIIALEVAEAEQAKARQQQRRTEAEDFKWLMANKQGRRFVRRLLEFTGVFKSTFRADNEMAFLEGQRNIGLLLMSEVNELCPEKYYTMMKEQKNARSDNDDS